MNRITAVLLAMVGLLVHALIIHRDVIGAFAPPFESAHAAYVLGRNLVHTGEAAWWIDPATGEATGGLWSYPSPLLVLLAAAAEFLNLNVDRAVQVACMVAALATVFLSTRFDTDRIAGVIPALLLVTSGSVAAAGASGSEWPIAMFSLATAFVSLEHGRPRYAAVALSLLVLSRPEGIFAAAALAVMTGMRRVRGPAPLERRPVPKLWTFVPAALVLWIADALGAPLLRDAKRILMLDDPTVAYGASQLADFAVSNVSPVLLVFPIVSLARGGLSAVGARALVLTFVWTAAAVAGGGGPAAYAIAFAPALPVAFIAIQQGMARALDTYRRSMERLVWASLIVVMSGALFASRFPGDLGRLRLLGAQESMFTARATAPLGNSELLARSALFSEIRLTRVLRRIGAFLDERLDAHTSVAAPWPSVLQWRSGTRIVDAYERTVPREGEERPRGRWSPAIGVVDVTAMLEAEPDYILPTAGALEDYVDGQLPDLLPDRLFRLDPKDGPALREFARTRLARYELVVTTGVPMRTREAAQPLLLARRRGAAPPLSIEARVDADIVQFDVASREHPKRDSCLPEVLDTVLTAVLEDGSRVVLDPRGAIVDDASKRSSAGLVIDPRWRKPVTVARFDRSDSEARLQSPIVRLELRLLHHRIAPTDPRADAADPVSLTLR